jgi:hypothetical protein
VWPYASTQATTADSVSGVLAAVHRPTVLKCSSNRRRNIVVKGLEPVDGFSGADLLPGLCEACLFC